MDPALASLLGAVIGGAIASGSNLLVERGRARRATDADRALADMEMRRAARLLYDELDHAELLLERPVDSKTFGANWEPPHRPLPLSMWTEQRRVLAAHGDEEVWGAVAAAFAERGLLDQWVVDLWEEDRYIGVPQPHHPLEARPVTSRMHQRFSEALSLVHAAQDRVVPLHGWPRAGRSSDGSRRVTPLVTTRLGDRVECSRAAVRFDALAHDASQVRLAR